MKGLFDALASDEPLDRFVYDAENDVLRHERTQDVQPFLEQNRRLQNDGDGYSQSRELRRIASIPNIVVEQWMQQGVNIFDEADWPKIAALLDSPEYAYLRTAPGRIGRGRGRSYFTLEGVRRSTAEQIQRLHRGVRG